MKNNVPLLVEIVCACLLLFTACEKDTPGRSDHPLHKPERPIARAGSDTTVYLPFTKCYLDGSASTDPDSNIVSYEWQLLTGPYPASIASYKQSQTTVSRLVDVGNYEFQLTVTDADGLSSRDTVIVKVAGPNCTGGNKEILFRNLSWDYSWIMEIDIFDFFSYLPPNSYIKKIYIKRDGSATWEEVVPSDWSSPNYGKVHEWGYGNGVLVIFPGNNTTDDTPDVKIEYCN